MDFLSWFAEVTDGIPQKRSSETMPATLEKELDGLYGLPPSEFIPARKELVKAYRKAGDGESAAVVGTARRPTLAAWTVNQLARQEKANVRALLNAGKRLRTAQRRALGGRSGAALRKHPTRNASPSSLCSMLPAAS
jgi:hypothetical protein